MKRTPKKFPIILGDKVIGFASPASEAWKIARPIVGNPDFEAYFDSATMTFQLYFGYRR